MGDRDDAPDAFSGLRQAAIDGDGYVVADPDTRSKQVDEAWPKWVSLLVYERTFEGLNLNQVAALVTEGRRPNFAPSVQLARAQKRFDQQTQDWDAYALSHLTYQGTVTCLRYGFPPYHPGEHLPGPHPRADFSESFFINCGLNVVRS